jgi:hypothetical protein
MRVTTMHYEDQQRRPRVLITFYREDGETSTLVLHREDWEILEKVMKTDPVFEVTDET